MAGPFLSIVIPTFNSAQALSKTLESVLGQTFSDIEVLVIDGLSTDNTVEIAQSFQDRRIRILSEKDNGVYDAMNKGISMSAGTWIYFLGSDDMLFSSRTLENVTARLKSTAAEFVYGNVRIDGDSPWAKHDSIYDGKFTREKLFRKNICHQAIFYSRQLFHRFGGYNQEYSVRGDWDFNHRCFASCQVEYIDEIVAIFKTGGRSSRNIPDKYFLEDSVINLKRYYGLSYRNQLFKSYANVFLTNAKNSIREGKVRSSVYFFFVAMLHSDYKIYVIKNYGLTVLDCVRQIFK
jgi:glycosyltransferase involved in cell wall biosynthesis